jgi:hypothetical protein
MRRHATWPGGRHGGMVLGAALAAAALAVGACGSSGSSTASPLAAVTPVASFVASPTDTVGATVTAPAATAAPSGGMVEGSTFRYEIKGAVAGKVDDGRVAFNSNPHEHVVLFVEGSLMPKSDVTLYFPLDFAAGTHALAPFREIVEEGRISATSTTLDGVFYTMSGTLDITSLEGGVMSGSFEFEAVDRADATRTVTVSGSFDGVQLPHV